LGLKFGVEGGVWGLGAGVWSGWGSGFRVQRSEGLGLKVVFGMWGLKFRVQVRPASR
jgi:hypothetical protein